MVALDFTMSEISLILVLHIKTNKTLNDMAKIQIKSKKLAPFGGKRLRVYTLHNSKKAVTAD